MGLLGAKRTVFGYEGGSSFNLLSAYDTRKFYFQLEKLTINNRFEQSGFNFILKAVMLDVVCDTCVGGRSLFLHFCQRENCKTR